ncbi:MAG: hypothetical protein KJN97_14895 [Deltaproteobacteria bacterium]|nr:hypothetical protein [Deltaproteobacteria bacterium]
MGGDGGAGGLGGDGGAGGIGGMGGSGGAMEPALSGSFDFTDASMSADGVVHFYVQSQHRVERLDLAARRWLAPLQGSSTTTAFAVSPDGASAYLSYLGGRIDEFDTATGQGAFFSATPETASTIHVVGPYLFTIDSSGAWDSHSLYDRATGARLFSDEWRDASRSMVYASSRERLLFLDSGSSPTDINYVDIDTSTATLSSEVDSPYHGSYSLPNPIRLTPDEQFVVVGNGNYFTVETLEYDRSFGLPHDDLVFHGSDLYLLDSIGQLAQIRVLDSGFNILHAEFVPGEARRLFEYDDSLVVITATGTAIEVRFLSLPLD